MGSSHGSDDVSASGNRTSLPYGDAGRSGSVSSVAAAGDAAAWQGYTRIARWLNPPVYDSLQVVGCVLVAAWCIWMWTSFKRQDLHSNLSFPLAYGVDFYNHLDRPARILWDGNDPYADPKFMQPYPPLVYRLFFWVNCMTSRAALATWLCCLTVMLAVGAWAAARTRRLLNLTAIPPVLAVGAVLFSTATLFAIERGQCDPLSVGLILLSLPMLRHRWPVVQFLAGVVLCIGPWTKVYPGLWLVGLIGLRCWRPLAGFVVGGGLVAALDFNAVQRWLAVSKGHRALAENWARFPFPQGGPAIWNHALPPTISNLLYHTRLDSFAPILGKLGAAALLTPLLAWVTWRVFRCSRREVLAYPYLLWIVALATFAAPISNDYNFCAMPLVVLALWDRRDPVLVHVVMVLLLLWWQPLPLTLGGREVFAFKFLGLAATGVCLVERAARLTLQASTEKSGGQDASIAVAPSAVAA